MNINCKDRKTRAYKELKELFKDGWYIRLSKYKDNIRVYTLTKDRNKYRTIKYYLAYDVCLALQKEFGYKIMPDKNFSVALNFNPLNYRPIKGHKMTV